MYEYRALRQPGAGAHLDELADAEAGRRRYAIRVTAASYVRLLRA